MTTDFAEYSDIIEEFKGKVSKANFEIKYAKATEHLETKDKFLLKMELKRLASPCVRLIDLRGLVDGECQVFEHEGRLHMLDKVAKRVFKKSIEQYGSYTFGVYEETRNTDNNYRVIYEKNKKNNTNPNEVTGTVDPIPVHEKHHFSGHFMPFGQYIARKEERMNFAITLTIKNEQGETINALSSDLSISGIKIRIDDEATFHLGEKVEVIFTGLEQEFEVGGLKLFYRIQNQEIGDNHYLGVVRCDAEIETDPFSKFLAGYINGNRRRYKINLENTYSAINSRGYEQFTIPNTCLLPVVLEKKSKSVVPRYALMSTHNGSTYKFWKNELSESTLEFLLTPDRIKRLRKLTNQESLQVYAFVHMNKGKTYFYSADSQQLKELPHLESFFLNFASKKRKFGIFNLTYRSINGVSAESDLSNKHFLEVRDSYLNQETSQEVKACLSRLTDLVCIEDLTKSTCFGDYQYLPDESKIDLSEIKIFGHPRPKKSQLVECVKLNYASYRQESRFNYVTSVSVENIDNTSGGVTGKTVDFSMLGLQVHLDEPSEFKKGDIVSITLPQLQKISNKFDLKDLPYLVVNTNEEKTTINLKVYVKKHQHIGRSFFKLLIEKNRDKLVGEDETVILPGLAKALRNIFARTITSTSFYVQTSGSRYKVSKIGSSSRDTNLLKMCDNFSAVENEYNLYPILHNHEFESQLITKMKSLVTNPEPVAFIFYIKYQENEAEVEDAVVAKLASEFTNDHQRKFFIKQAKKNGQFFCFKLVLSRAETPSMTVLGPELSYVSHYAIHRAKKLEDELWSVVGLAEITDITDEVLYRTKLLGRYLPQALVEE